MSLLKVKPTRVSSAEASHWTVRRRSSEMSSVPDFISGGAASAQLQDELAILTESEKTELLKPAPTKLSVADSLAIKVGTLLPWNKIRIMRRYISSNIQSCTYTHMYYTSYFSQKVNALPGI